MNPQINPFQLFILATSANISSVYLITTRACLRMCCKPHLVEFNLNQFLQLDNMVREELDNSRLVCRVQHGETHPFDHGTSDLVGERRSCEDAVWNVDGSLLLVSR